MAVRINLDEIHSIIWSISRPSIDELKAVSIGNSYISMFNQVRPALEPARFFLPSPVVVSNPFLFHNGISMEPGIAIYQKFAISSIFHLYLFTRWDMCTRDLTIYRKGTGTYTHKTDWCHLRQTCSWYPPTIRGNDTRPKSWFRLEIPDGNFRTDKWNYYKVCHVICSSDILIELPGSAGHTKINKPHFKSSAKNFWSVVHKRDSRPI